MKAYLIGGAADQTKEIVRDPPPRVYRRAWAEGVLTRTVNPDPDTEPTVRVHYDDYLLYEVSMPDGSGPVAIYLFAGTRRGS